MLLKNKGGILQLLANRLFTIVINIGEAKGVEAGNIIKEILEKRLFIFIGKFMRIPTEKFLRDMRFTILMTINWITPLKTLQLCYAKTINSNTEEKVLRPLEKIWIESDLLQKSGTEVQKVRNGILSMERKIIKKENQWKRYVLRAMNYFKIFRGEKVQNIVQINVNQSTEEILARTMKFEFVHFVTKCLKLINTILLRHVHVVAAIDTDIKKNVYNLQIDSDIHEYYANGILVANCSRYALESETASLKVTPRVGMVSKSLENPVVKTRPVAKPGEHIIEIWEGDKVIGFEVIRPGKVPAMPFGLGPM